MPDLQFAVNHHGDPDVAIFDFTSMFAANNSAYVQEKFGKQLLCGLVGDGLLEVGRLDKTFDDFLIKWFFILFICSPFGQQVLGVPEAFLEHLIAAI